MNAMTTGAEFRLSAEGECGWILVKTKQHVEVRTKDRIEDRLRLEVYLPMKLVEDRRKRLIGVPFLPGYLFVRVSANVSAWRGLYSTEGVAEVVGVKPNRIIALREFVIERIRAQEDGGFIKLGLRRDAAKEFKNGDAVRVCDDLALEGLFDEVIDAKRCWILTNLLGGKTRAVVDLAKLAPREL